MIKRPLVGIAIIFSLGIFSASKIKIPLILPCFFLIIFLILGLLALKKRIFFDIFLSCLIFSLGIAFIKSSQSLSRIDISKLVYYRNDQPYIVKGFISAEPIFKDQKTSFIFTTQVIEIGNLSKSCCGNILVRLNGGKDLSYGEGLILRGSLYRPFSNRDSRRQSYREYLYNQGIYFIMNVKTEADLVRLNKNRGLPIKRFALSLKQKVENIFLPHTSPLTLAILEAMVLGEKKNIPWFVNDTMMKSGTIHILVVSGFNVGIVSFIIILFLKLLRIPRKPRFIIAIPCLLLYCLLTGASNPVARSTVMAVVFMLGFLLKREPDIYNSLSIASLFILTVNPRQLFDIGFQLSFASVIAIVYLYPKIRTFLQIESLKTKYLKILLDGCLVSFSAWLASAAFIAYYFKIFSPITVVANIFIVPLATLITLCGFSLILTGLIFPPLAPFFASTSELVVMLLIKVNMLLASLPLAYFRLP